MLKAFVYFNLHRKCWSVKALEGAHKGRVVAHCDSFAMEGCIFKVSQAGRARVIAEKRKNVHAGIVGYMVSLDKGLQEPMEGPSVPVTYNPYTGAHFVTADLLREPVSTAQRVVAIGRRVVALQSLTRP